MGLAELRKALEQAVAQLDPDVLEGPAAAEAVKQFARIEKVAAAGKALCARRVADSGQWRRHGDRSPAEWLARTTKSSIGQAGRLLETAEGLKLLPGTARAFRAGRLSETAAAEIVSAAAVNPTSEKRLLQCADRESLSGLRERCRTERAAAQDELDRYRRIHRSRSFRTWVDSDGAGCLLARGTPDCLAELRATMQPFEARVFEQARKEGMREQSDAYAFDAFMAMVRAKGGGTGAAGPRAKVIALIDHAALVRGRADPSQTCELAGVGRVPVATIEAMMADAFLAAVVTDGVDVYNVAHLNRQSTAYQRTALEARDLQCVVPGCRARTGLEIDHVDGWAATLRTKLNKLALLCHFHHHQKTYDGYRLEGAPGRWRWIPPPNAHAPPDDREDEPDLETAMANLQEALKDVVRAGS